MYRLKVAKFQMWSLSEVFTLPLQKKNTCGPETYNKNSQPQQLRAKAEIAKFHLAMAKGNYLTFAETVYRLKVAKFKMLSMIKVFTLLLKKKNTCVLETYHKNAHPQHLRAKAKISEIGWIRLEIQDFCCHSVQVKCGKISNVVDAQSFHVAIAKVKYLRTLNFSPKLPPWTSSSWGKDFENRLDTFGDIAFLLARCTGRKWQNFKCCRWSKFSPCYWKRKIPAYLKLTTKMPTLNIFELRQRFRKSVEYFWKYRIFAGSVYMFKSGKISNVVYAQSFHVAIAKVKYRFTLNFSPKFPPSTSSSWGKDFENRLDTFGDIGFFLAQCTGSKVAKSQILSMRKVFTLPLQK